MSRHTNANGAVLLRADGLSKTYPNGTRALRSAGFTIGYGEIVGLVGSNGAGKSTVIKILSGVTARSSGRLTWDGEDVDWSSPFDARAHGVSTIHQQIPLIAALSVIENVFLARKGIRRQSRALRAEFTKLVTETGLELDPDTLVSDLNIGARQIVSILQALASDAKLVIMDEPTASLSAREREIVFEIVKHLAQARGTAFLFVSHFLDEVLNLCQRIVVLRDGVTIADASRADFDEAGLVEAILGLTLGKRSPRPVSTKTGVPRLKMQDIHFRGSRLPLSLEVGAGEVVGLAGLLGSGRSEILGAIYGDGRRAGSVTVDGLAVGASIAAAMQAGIAFVPEDRNSQALFLNQSIRQNLAINRLGRLSRFGIGPLPGPEIEFACKVISRLRVRTSSPDEVVGNLSGGNAQKLTIGRWMECGTKVFLLDEPTAGVDIGAKAEIHRLVDELAEQGAAIIYVSSDFEEMLAVCHRLLVIAEGRIVDERWAAETTDHALFAVASRRMQGETVQ